MFKPTSLRAVSRSVSRQQPQQARRGAFTGPARGAAAGLLGGLVAYQLSTQPVVKTEAAALPNEDLKSKLSAQHAQVKNSWEHPGVYAWGNNIGRVVAPDSTEDCVKSPRRIPFFDNVLLRALKLDRDIGVAVTEAGDILQWGTGYAPDATAPEKTLTGKNISTVEISADRLFALSKDGTVYSMPLAKKDQLSGAKPEEASWIPGMGGTAKLSYRTLKPELNYFESVSAISAGRDHILLLTTSGRVFSAAASYTYPTHGQLGLPLSARPPHLPYDHCHPLPLPPISSIATGDHHSLALTPTGTLYTFGLFGTGALCHPPTTPPTLSLPTPTPLTSFPQKITAIAAAGNNTFLTTTDPSPALYAAGTGIHGTLGTGRWTHVQPTPAKIAPLSNLSEYSETQQRTVPIGIHAVCAGPTHACAILRNAVNVDAPASGGSSTDTNYGRDALWWGGNEWYQLGTGRRSNSSVPVYIAPLEPVRVAGGSMTGSSSEGDLERRSGIIGGHGEEVGSGRGTRRVQVHRFQVAPEKRVEVGGRKVRVEQRVVCGRGNSAVYSGV